MRKFIWIRRKLMKIWDLHQPIITRENACPKAHISVFKVLANEDTVLRTQCCSWCFLGCANWETFVADTKCFWTKSETFFVSRTQNLCPQQMLRARANGETFVSATMCPRLRWRWLIDFTLPNARRVYSSKGDSLGVKGVKRKNTKNCWYCTTMSNWSIVRV